MSGSVQELRDVLKPSDLPLHEGFALGPLVDSFDHAEAEWCAVWLVRYLASTGDTWRPFGLPGMLPWLWAQQRAAAKPTDGPFNPIVSCQKGWDLLHEKGWLVRVAPETPEGVDITDEFLRRCLMGCFRLRPKLRRFFRLIDFATARTA